MIILHGDNQVSSRAQLTVLKQEAVKADKQVIELDGETPLGKWVSAVESNSLFGSSHLVTVENIFFSRPSNQKNAVVGYLLKHSAADIVIWEGKDVSSKIKDFDPKIVRRFDLPKAVFKFLDDFSFTNLQLALTNTAPEQILALLAGHIHKLILVKEGQANLPSWQLAKLQALAKRFSLDQLQSHVRALLEIDFLQKTSAAPYDLGTALELWTASL